MANSVPQGRLLRSGGFLISGALLIALLPILSLADSVATPSDTSQWKGRTVALTDRPMARFMSYTSSMMAFGPLGIAAAAADGKAIVRGNEIANPAPRMVKSLYDAAQGHYSLGPAKQERPRVDSSDAKAIAKAAAGAELVFDVEPVSWSLEPLLTAHGRYFVTQEFRFRVIDAVSGSTIRDEHCVQTSQRDPVLPARSELLEDHAKRLKATLTSQQDFCVEYFGLTALQLPPQETHPQ